MKEYYVSIDKESYAVVTGDSISWEDDDLWIMKDGACVACFKEWDYWIDLSVVDKEKKCCF